MNKVTLRGQKHIDGEREVTVVVFKDGHLGIRLHNKKINYGEKFRISRLGAQILLNNLTKVLANDCVKWKEDDPSKMQWVLAVRP